MLKETVVNNKVVLEYTLYAFTTDKGTYRLVGSDSNGDDTFRIVGTSTFHTWKRSQIYDWYKANKITPLPTATTIIYF